MPGKKPGKSVKKPAVYEALKNQGMSKEQAAKISNAQAAKASPGASGKPTGKPPVAKPPVKPPVKKAVPKKKKS